MDPLDSTAILDRAAQSLLRPSAGRRSERGVLPTSTGTAASASHLFDVRPRSSASSAMENPRAMLRRAQQVLELAAMSGSTDVFRRQIAVAAYLAEMEAQREMARLQREALMAREWFA